MAVLPHEYLLFYNTDTFDFHAFCMKSVQILQECNQNYLNPRVSYIQFLEYYQQMWL